MEKVQWAKFIETNSLKTVEELLEDDYGMIDGIINNGVKEDKDAKKESVIGKLSEHKEAVAKHEKGWNNRMATVADLLREMGNQEFIITISFDKEGNHGGEH